MGFYLYGSDDKKTNTYINSAYLRYILLNSNESPTKNNTDMASLINLEGNVREKLNIPFEKKTAEEIFNELSELFKNDSDYENIISTLLTFNKSTILAIYYIYNKNTSTSSMHDSIKEIITSTNAKTRTELIIGYLTKIDDEDKISLFDNLESALSELKYSPDDSMGTRFSKTKSTKIPNIFHKFNPLAFYFNNMNYNNTTMKYCKARTFGDVINIWNESINSSTHEDTYPYNSAAGRTTFLRKYSLGDFESELFPRSWQTFYNGHLDYLNINDDILNDTSHITDDKGYFYVDMGLLNYLPLNTYNRYDGGKSQYDFCADMLYKIDLVGKLYDFFYDIVGDTSESYGHWYFDLDQGEADACLKEATDTWSANMMAAIEILLNNPIFHYTDAQKEEAKSKYRANIAKAVSLINKPQVGFFNKAIESDSSFRTFFDRRYYLDATPIFEDVLMNNLFNASVNDFNNRLLSTSNKYVYLQNNYSISFNDEVKAMYGAHYNNSLHHGWYYHKNSFTDGASAPTLPKNIFSKLVNFISSGSTSGTDYQNSFSTESPSAYYDGNQTYPNLYNVTGKTINVSGWPFSFEFNYYPTNGEMLRYLFTTRNSYSDRGAEFLDRNYKFNIQEYDTNKGIGDTDDPSKIQSIKKLKVNFTIGEKYSDTVRGLLNNYGSSTTVSQFDYLKDLDYVIDDLGFFRCIGTASNLDGTIRNIYKYMDSELDVNKLVGNQNIINYYKSQLADAITTYQRKNPYMTNKEKINFYYAKTILNKYFEYLFDNSIDKSFNYFNIQEDNVDIVNNAQFKLYKLIFIYRHCLLNGKKVFDATSDLFRNYINKFVSEDMNEYIDYYKNIISDTSCFEYIDKSISDYKKFYNIFMEKRNIVLDCLEKSKCNVLID